MQIDLIIRKANDPNPVTVTCDLIDRLVFGRGITSPVAFEGSEISREHFAFVLRQGGVFMEDLSSNGTRVNGSTISSSKPKRLLEGDVISIPGYEIEIERRVPPAAAAPDAAAFAPLLPAPATTSARLFSAWEIIVVVAAVASFGLIFYYLFH